MAFNLEKITIENECLDRVIETTKFQQLVLMSIKDCIPLEIHNKNDQFIKIEQGKCHVKILNEIYELENGDSITIPAGNSHEIKNILYTPLKLYTIYAPPHHPKGLTQLNRP